MSTALIVGSRGQDGRLLSEALTRAGRRVVGVHRTGVELLEGDERTSLQSGPTDLGCPSLWSSLAWELAPEEAYYLAAAHGSTEQNEPDVQEIFRTNLTGVALLIEALRLRRPDARLFYASSCHIFAGAPDSPQNESTPPAPRDWYGVSKLGGMAAVRLARDTYGLHASSGILYHHDSEYRPDGFVATRIVDAALDIAAGRGDRLVVGDVSARLDWGYARDYVAAMREIVAQPEPDDYVVATGCLTSVADFIDAVGAVVGVDLAGFVVERPELITRRWPSTLMGDPSRLGERTGWAPKVGVRGLAERIVEGRSGSRRTA